MKRIITCLLCVAILCGCKSTVPQKNSDKLTIVATVFPLYDFAKQICGNRANVKMLIKPGTEVHSYDPLPSDMLAVYESDLFLYIGGESDKWVESLLDDRNINTLSLIGCVQDHTEHHDGHTHTDEHIWTSPQNAVLMLEKICESIVKTDPENTEYYQDNCDVYINKINNASKEIKTVVSEKKNQFIVVADRFPFAYFTEYFGLEYDAAFDGCAISTDISLKTMSRLSKTIEKRGVKTVFVTELSSQNIAKALRDELGVTVLELHSAHNVSADDFKQNVSYLDIMKRNKAALERGLNNELD